MLPLHVPTTCSVAGCRIQHSSAAGSCAAGRRDKAHALSAVEEPLLEKPEGQGEGSQTKASSPSRTIQTLLSYSVVDAPLLSAAFAAGVRREAYAAA